jgi:hypothetical protein
MPFRTSGRSVVCLEKLNLISYELKMLVFLLSDCINGIWYPEKKFIKNPFGKNLES